MDVRFVRGSVLARANSDSDADRSTLSYSSLGKLEFPLLCSSKEESLASDVLEGLPCDEDVEFLSRGSPCDRSIEMRLRDYS